MENTVIHDHPIPVDEPIVTKMCYSIADIELILGISRPSVIKLLKQNEFKWLKSEQYTGSQSPALKHGCRKPSDCQGCHQLHLAKSTS